MPEWEPYEWITVRKILSAEEYKQHCKNPEVHVAVDTESIPENDKYFLAEDDDNFLMVCKCEDEWQRVGLSRGKRRAK